MTTQQRDERTCITCGRAFRGATDACGPKCTTYARMGDAEWHQRIRAKMSDRDKQIADAIQELDLCERTGSAERIAELEAIVAEHIAEQAAAIRAADSPVERRKRAAWAESPPVEMPSGVADRQWNGNRLERSE